MRNGEDEFYEEDDDEDDASEEDKIEWVGAGAGAEQEQSRSRAGAEQEQNQHEAFYSWWSKRFRNARKERAQKAWLLQKSLLRL